MTSLTFPWMPRAWNMANEGAPWDRRLHLYHYTSQEGLRAILATGVILPSFHHGHPTGRVAGRDVTAGAVFLTDKDPDTYSREMVAYNNYGLGWNKGTRVARVEACLEVAVLPGAWMVREDQLRPMVGEVERRNVIAWLHPRGLVLWQPDPWSAEGWTLLTPYQVRYTRSSPTDAATLLRLGLNVKDSSPPWTSRGRPRSQ